MVKVSMLLGMSVLQTWSPDGELNHHLGTCYKCTFLPPTHTSGVRNPGMGPCTKPARWFQCKQRSVKTMYVKLSVWLRGRSTDTAFKRCLYCSCYLALLPLIQIYFVKFMVKVSIFRPINTVTCKQCHRTKYTNSYPLPNYMARGYTSILKVSF